MVRGVGSASFRYQFKEPPRVVGELPTFLNDELKKISDATNAALDGQHELQTTAPDKPRAGMVRYADGVQWAPGHGAGLFQYSGTGWKQLTPYTGRAVLVGGTVTVSLASVTANSNIFVTCQVPGGTTGFLGISARSVGASFTILSSSGTDTSTVAYWITEP